MPKIIALTGRAGSGKTTAAEYFIKKGYKHINFKDELIKEMKVTMSGVLEVLSKEFGLSIDDLFVEKPGIMRKFMQHYGTDLRRGDDPEYWTQKWLDIVENEDKVVVDDVRFLNESHAVKVLGGKIIRVWREGLVMMDHVSEVEMEEIYADHTIENNGLISEMYDKLADAEWS